LLDLGGHTADNRPAFLNQRFAPVQATYLGFYGPSYGSECDWWIVDRFIAARTAKSYPGAEPMWELPCPSLCYDPSLHRLPCIDQLRYDHSSSLVIGSFNHTRKLTDQSIARISSILRANPSALFKFRAHSFYDPAVRRFFLQRFVDHGVSPSQLAAIPYAFNPAEAMMDFCRLHLHLDSFPVSGTTTTLDALAMGVPVLTCPNALYAGSISASLLESIGLDSMVCEQASDLPDCANQLFQRYRLPEERRRLATLVRHSALCDSESTPWHFSAALGAMLKSST
jgi:predicted O-linked N-acetylglucosamine transferase (SPINDLY family)